MSQFANFSFAFITVGFTNFDLKKIMLHLQCKCRISNPNESKFGEL